MVFAPEKLKSTIGGVPVAEGLGAAKGGRVTGSALIGRDDQPLEAFSPLPETSTPGCTMEESEATVAGPRSDMESVVVIDVNEGTFKPGGTSADSSSVSDRSVSESVSGPISADPNASLVGLAGNEGTWSFLVAIADDNCQERILKVVSGCRESCALSALSEQSDD